MLSKAKGKKFSVIYADPPWHFKAWSKFKSLPDGSKTRATERFYKTMSLKQIKEMPIDNIAAEDCVLFMWVIMPMLPEALEVIKAWGFKYKTVAFTWMKQNPKAPTLFYDANDIFKGLGFWTRANCELCILATRGKPKRQHADVPQAIFSPVRQHSRKPTEVYDRIERLLAGPYVELFARTRREGWTSLGNQITKFERVRAKGASGKRVTQPPRRKKNVS